MDDKLRTIYWIALTAGVLITIYGYVPYLILQSDLGNINMQPGGCLGTVDVCAELPLMYQSAYPGYQTAMIIGPILLFVAVLIKFYTKKSSKKKR